MLDHRRQVDTKVDVVVKHLRLFPAGRLSIIHPSAAYLVATIVSQWASVHHQYSRVAVPRSRSRGVTLQRITAGRDEFRRAADLSPSFGGVVTGADQQHQGRGREAEHRHEQAEQGVAAEG